MPSSPLLSVLLWGFTRSIQSKTLSSNSSHPKKLRLFCFPDVFHNPTSPTSRFCLYKPKSPSEVLSQRWIHKGSSQKGFCGAGRSCRTHEFLTDRRTEARQDRRFTEVAEEHVLLFVVSNGQFVSGVHGWGLPDTGVFLKTQLFEVVIRESVIRNSFRNKNKNGFLRTRGEKQNRRNCHPKQLSNKKKQNTKRGRKNDFQQPNGMQWFQFWIILENHAMGVIVFYKNCVYIYII